MQILQYFYISIAIDAFWRPLLAHVLVRCESCQCHSVYQDVILVISLELFFAPALIGSHVTHCTYWKVFLFYNFLKNSLQGCL